MCVLLMDSFLAVWKVHKMTTSLHSVAGVCIESANVCDFYTPRSLTISFPALWTVQESDPLSLHSMARSWCA